ncbi:uncharacterized protein [Asterias amurensis]|uniref:uncharacterized protein n=1 Tax=Asterias amurensis TaxID=7602 RepID=UPI003AB29FD9
MEGCVNAMWICTCVLLVGSWTAIADSEGTLLDYPVGSSQSIYVDEYPNCSSVSDSSSDECADFLEDLFCGIADILLNDSSPVLTVQAPPGIDENQCRTSLSCAWFIASDPGTSIYIQVHAQRGAHNTYSYSLYDEVVIGRGHDPFDGSSVVVERGISRLCLV